MGQKMRIIAIAIVAAAVIAVALPADSASASGYYKTHCVQYGETLYSIGRMYGVSPYSIAHANGLANPNYIRGGQCLRIPAHGHGHGYDTGYKHPTSPQVPGRCDTNPQCCYKPAPSWCHYKPAPQHPAYHPPKPSGFTYCVQYCDTLSSIGARFGVSPWAIARANGLANPNYIRAGQCLVIPRY